MSWRRTYRKVAEPLAASAHVLHGTRGLAIGAAGLLVLGLLQPWLPPAWSRFWIVAPVFVILVIGLATLPREGVAVQHRARSLLDAEHGAGRLARALIWPSLVLIFLIPRLFLGAYGIPHMTPLTGLILPSLQQRLTHGFLFAVLLGVVFYVRSTKRYARHIIPRRPRDLSREDHSHQERDTILWLGLALAVAFLYMLRSFWQPFSLIDWSPDLSSLRVGARGVTSITFSIALPLLFFTTIAGHASLLRELIQRDMWQERRDLVALATTHIALGIACVVLHAYDLLWIAQYRASAPF